MKTKNNFNKITKSLALLILFFLPAYLVRIRYGWLSVNILELLILATSISWSLDKLSKNELDSGSFWFLKEKRYFFWILLILAGVILSILYNKSYYSGLGALKGWFIAPLLFSILYHDSIKKNSAMLEKSLYALFFSGSTVAILGLGYWLLRILTYDGRLKIFFNSPNELAMYLSIAFLAGTALFLKARGNKEKLFIIFGVILILVNLFLTFSLAAWAGAMLSLGVMLLILEPGKFIKITLTTLILLVLAVTSQTGNKKIHDLLLENGRSSLDSRIQIWKSSALMIKDNLIFGIGPANFQDKYLEYQKYFPPYLEWAVPQPHNLYLAFWLEAGLLGMVGFAGLIMKFFRDNKKAITNNRLMGALCISIMTYFLIHGILDTTYWRNDMALLFWLFIALNIYVAQSSNHSSLERSL